jgi:hypothetical protein
MKQATILIISSTPSLKNIAQVSSHSLWPNQLIFTVSRISTLYGSLRTEVELGDPKLVFGPWLVHSMISTWEPQAFRP